MNPHQPLQRKWGGTTFGRRVRPTVWTRIHLTPTTIWKICSSCQLIGTHKSMMNIITKGFGPAMKTIPTMPPIPLREFKLCIKAYLGSPVHPNPLQRVSRLWNSHVIRRVLLESMVLMAGPNALLNSLGIHYRSDSWRSQAQKQGELPFLALRQKRKKIVLFHTCLIKWFSIQVSNEKLKRNKHSKSWW